MKDKPKPAVPPTPIPPKEEKRPGPEAHPPSRHVVIEIRGNAAAIVQNGCASNFELRQVLEDLLISMTRGQ